MIIFKNHAVIVDHYTYHRRKPKKTVNLHSDQGSQYTSKECKKLLKLLNIEASMSRRGNCWDNAVAGSFFQQSKEGKKSTPSL